MILHAGCGNGKLPSWFTGHEEVRLDIDPACNPQIVASICSMGDVGQFDIVYCSHVLEHLERWDVPKALSEFRRVVKPGGMVMVIVPDLHGAEPTEDVLYESPVGPITGIDLIYGYGPDILTGNEYMRHRTGFVRKTLRAALEACGFADVQMHRLECFTLMGVAIAP